MHPKVLPFALAALLSSSTVFAAAPAVSMGSNGLLQYTPDSNGNNIIDFSYAGYEGGGVALPVLTVEKTLKPSGGDDTSAIQAAINAVAAMTPDANGFRGAVLLDAGTFNVSSGLTLTASGVVLRGSGSGSGGTEIKMTQKTPFNLVTIGSTSATWTTSGSSPTMTASYVPSGARTFAVSSTSGFSVGQGILVNRPVTSAWIAFMGMNTLTRNGSPETWLAAGTVVTADRIITAISGNTITVDAPVCDSYDSKYTTGSITAYTFSGRTSQSGVEHFSVIAPALNVDISDPQYTGLNFGAAINCWANDIAFQDTQNTVTVALTTKELTLNAIKINHTVDHTGDRMADFGVAGTQVFMNDCSSDGTGEWPMVTQELTTGPIADLNFDSTEAVGISPHQRWMVGLLVDGGNLPNAVNGPDGGDNGIFFGNRGYLGSGQGWAAGWSIAWNTSTPYFVVEMPPGGYNWCYGCIGEEITATEPGTSNVMPNGVYVSLGTNIKNPPSLYLEQLLERLGPQAVLNIGYNPPNTVATPTFSPVGGTYTSAQNVTISTTTSGATIRYTTDGSTPTTTSGTVYGGAIAVSSNTTINAIAYESGFTASPVATASYTIASTVAAPTFSPVAGTYTGTQSVAISTTTSGASIRYTTDGSTPSETAGTLYTVPVSVASSLTLNAIAYESGMTDSPVSSAAYTINVGGGTKVTFLATSLSYAGSGASTSLQTDTHYNPDEWVELAATGTGQSITYTTGSVTAGTYQLSMEWKGNNTRGELSLSVDGGAAMTPNPLDQYSSGETYPTTTFSPNLTFSSAGTHKIKLTVTGKNGSSSGYQLSTYNFTLTPN
jgi:hypothetical protein